MRRIELRKKVIEVLFLSITLMCFVGSHLLYELSRHLPYPLFFGIRVSMILFVDILLGISILLPLVVIMSIMRD